MLECRFNKTMHHVIIINNKARMCVWLVAGSGRGPRTAITHEFGGYNLAVSLNGQLRDSDPDHF